MSMKDQTDEPVPVVRLEKCDVMRTDDNTFLLPVLVECQGKSVPCYVPLSLSEAALLQAQLSHHLNRGWAMTEKEQVARQLGEIYPVGGSGRLA